MGHLFGLSHLSFAGAVLCVATVNLFIRVLTCRTLGVLSGKVNETSYHESIQETRDKIANTSSFGKLIIILIIL
jgi:hypothetical protein